MEIIVPATSANLGPGFDTLGLAIDLQNIAIIERSKYKSLALFGYEPKSQKIKQDNMFVNIFTNKYQQLTTDKSNFSFKLYNNIPISRGLGSSSAIIVGALKAAYKMADIDINRSDLLNEALKLEPHPDNIAPAIFGGFTVSVVKDKKVVVSKKNISDNLLAVIVIPNRHMSTYRSRREMPTSYNIKDTVYNISRSSLMTAAFFSEDYELLRTASMDRVHQYYRMKSFPELFAVQKESLNNGAIMSTLSGSGSSFFCLTYKDDADSLKMVLKKRFPHFKIKVFGFNNRGLNIK